MSLVAALLIVAQSTAPQIADASAKAPAARSNPVAVQARATVRIIRPASIDFSQFDEASETAADPNARETQRSRDAAGTPWIEFS
jgi:hypothetical protein